MKPRLLEYLICPSCGGALNLAAELREDDGEIMAGTLRCLSCSRVYPIRRGVPRFADVISVDAENAATARNFGWQWRHFTHHEEGYGDQFLGWIAPVTPQFFKDKIVLEGGCGKGRHTRLAAEWQARDVIGVDLSEAVETAFAATRGLENAHIVQADIHNLPVAPVIDYAFSVGVLHHLPDPQSGFRSLVSKVTKGGHVSAWVYGAENNAWITRWISPLRERVTSRINRRLLLHVSKVPTLVVYAATKLVYGPLNRSDGGVTLARNLFYNDYMSAISGFGWREQHSIVFDHLVAPTAFYIPRAEFERWWAEAGATDVVIGWHSKNSWRGFGRIGDG
jgi:SAM-dependent methyltransferase